MTGIVIGKDQCPECAKHGRDTSKDNMALYDDGGRHCFSCGYTILSEAYKRENGLIQEKEEEYSFIGMREFTKEDHELFKKNTAIKAFGYRGIRDEIYAKFGVRHAYNTEGHVELIAQYYPITKDWQFCGYKKRTLPKSFTDGHLGHFGSDCDLFGQFRFKNPNSKICVIVGGEVDQLSAYQMLLDDAQLRGKDYEPVVVSPVVGEVSTATQIKKHYNWFDKFDKIYLCFDNDEAGRKATDRAAKALPKDKVYVVPMSLKDPNEYLKEGKEALWINEFFKATHYVPVGVAGSDQLYNGILDNALTPKIPLPGFMHEITKALAGGIPGSGKIINLGAASGAGKTSWINEIIYHWLFHCAYKVGIVSMELDKAEYGEVLLSRHIGRKLALIEKPQDKLDFLKREDIKDKANNLFLNENGIPRFYLVDDRDGTLKQLQRTVEELIISFDCKVIVLDPIQDLLDGMSNEDQAVFMKWQKSWKKSHGITFFNVNHLRKSNSTDGAGSTGAFITEEDFAGSSTIFKSADLNILIMRDKYNEDLIMRNTTRVTISKCRWTGFTGPVGEYYYDNETHTLWDKQDWMAKFHPDFDNEG